MHAACTYIASILCSLHIRRTPQTGKWVKWYPARSTGFCVRILSKTLHLSCKTGSPIRLITMRCKIWRMFLFVWTGSSEVGSQALSVKRASGFCALLAYGSLPQWTRSTQSIWGHGNLHIHTCPHTLKLDACYTLSILPLNPIHMQICHGRWALFSHTLSQIRSSAKDI